MYDFVVLIIELFLLVCGSVASLYLVAELMYQRRNRQTARGIDRGLDLTRKDLLPNKPAFFLDMTLIFEPDPDVEEQEPHSYSSIGNGKPISISDIRSVKAVKFTSSECVKSIECIIFFDDCETETKYHVTVLGCVAMCDFPEGLHADNCSYLALSITIGDDGITYHPGLEIIPYFEQEAWKLAGIAAKDAQVCLRRQWGNDDVQVQPKPVAISPRSDEYGYALGLMIFDDKRCISIEFPIWKLSMDYISTTQFFEDVETQFRRALMGNGGGGGPGFIC